MTEIKASICLSTYNKPTYLKRVLDSIVCQNPGFDYEIIVVDDGSPEIETEAICLSYKLENLRYYRINRRAIYRNPSVARNFSYDRANGDILILQSDDVVHVGETISKLVELLKEGRFVISTVYNVDFDTGQPVYYCRRWFQFTGPRLNRDHSPNPTRPLFFLGSIYRKDVLAVGGCDEDFEEPGKDDIWFADCLMNGLKLKPYYASEVVGHHLHHERPENLSSRTVKSSTVYNRKYRRARMTGVWKAERGLLANAAVPVAST